MTIYDNNGQELLEVYPDDSSQRTATLKGEDVITLRFQIAEYIDIPTGAYIEFEYNAYYVERPCDVTIRHRRQYEYELRMQTRASRLKYTVMRYTDDGRTSFPLTGTLQQHADALVAALNANDAEQSWEVGALLQEAGEKTVMYDNVTCQQALDLIADAFDTEWEVDAYTISVTRIVKFESNPLRLSYGKGNGLRTGVVRKPYGDTPPVKRLYPIGSERNVSVGTYGAKSLRMPSQHGGMVIGYDGQYFSWHSQFRQSTAKYFHVSEDGTALTYAGTSQAMPSPYLSFGQAEEVRNYDDIYPHREGRVSSVVVTQDAEGNDLYAFNDATIPATLDFTQCMIPGETLKVTFQSGMLAGRTFDVQYSHNAQSPFPARTFKIIPAELDGMTMPGGQFVPDAGDRYGVFGMSLPQSYIRDDSTHTGAEWDLFKEAVKYMYSNVTEYSYSCELDPIWLIDNWSFARPRMTPGTMCVITDHSVQEEPYNVRIVKITQNVNNEKVVRCELAEQPERPGIVKRRLFADARQALEMQNAVTNSVTQIGTEGGTVITGVVTLYATTSGQQMPDMFTSETIPPMNSNTAKYLWKKTVTTYSDGTSYEDVGVAAVYGDTGQAADVLPMITSSQEGTNFTYTPGNKPRYNIYELNGKDLNITLKGSSKVADRVYVQNVGNVLRTVTITPPSLYSAVGQNVVNVEPGSSKMIEYLAVGGIKKLIVSVNEIDTGK